MPSVDQMARQRSLSLPGPSAHNEVSAVRRLQESIEGPLDFGPADEDAIPLGDLARLYRKIVVAFRNCRRGIGLDDRKLLP